MPFFLSRKGGLAVDEVCGFCFGLLFGACREQGDGDPEEGEEACGGEHDEHGLKDCQGVFQDCQGVHGVLPFVGVVLWVYRLDFGAAFLGFDNVCPFAK